MACHRQMFLCLKLNLTHSRNVFLLLNILLITNLVQYGVGAGQISGFRVDQTADENGWSEVRNERAYIYADYDVTLRLFGRFFKSGGEISFAIKPGQRGENCRDLRMTEIFEIRVESNETAVVKVNLRLLRDQKVYYYFCMRDRNVAYDEVSTAQFLHQGSEVWLQIGTSISPEKYDMLPKWLMIVILTFLLLFSGIFSGLNLGLMSIDKTELEILINSGTQKEKEYAKVIHPVRSHGNFLLCTILLSNVLINSTMAILLEDVTGSGVVAVVGATLGIVIFGEIVPQAVCTRHGLAVGARTIWFTKFFMFLTFPVSYPISRILDCVLGKEIGHVYSRDRFRELIHLTEKQTDLRKEEVNIITGALELSTKTVSNIMTNLEDVFMIEVDSVLDFETMNLIMKNGYSRIPVYKNNIKDIVGLLNIKDLAFVDPDDRMPLRTVVKFYSHPVVFVLQDTPLDVMLQEFKKGHSHLAVVQRVNSEGLGDPCYEPLGLVTLEDIIEEIIQAEIVDETDIITDNRKRLPRKVACQKDFSVFRDDHPDLSPQLALTTFQFLSTSVAPFRPELISENVLRMIIKQNVISFNISSHSSSDCFIYVAGKPCDFFVMILQGRVEVKYVKDGILFEGGPFTFFGIQTLQDLLPNPSGFDSTANINTTTRRQSTVNFVPDFTVRAISDLQYICVTRAQHIIAMNATLMERQPKTPKNTSSTDNFQMNWEELSSKEVAQI